MDYFVNPKSEMFISFKECKVIVEKQAG